MVSLLAVVVILGVVATVVISASSSSPSPTAEPGGGTTTTTGITSIGSDATQAAVSSCIADFTAVTTAISTYETLQDAAPPAGSTWATSGTDAILSTWPSDPPYFRLTWNGRTLDVIPERGTPSRGTSGTSTPPTGCYAA
jgi:hypothetical protein